MTPAGDIGAALLSPVLIVFVSACLGVLMEAFVPRQLRDEAQAIVSVVGLLAAGGLLWCCFSGGNQRPRAVCPLPAGARGGRR